VAGHPWGYSELAEAITSPLGRSAGTTQAGGVLRMLAKYGPCERATFSSLYDKGTCRSGQRVCWCRSPMRFTTVTPTSSNTPAWGSPFTSIGVVVAEEAANFFSNARMLLLQALIFLTAITAAYEATLSIRANIGESPFVFLRLLTMAHDPMPSFIALLGFLIPLVAIAIGYDAINGGFHLRTQRRMSPEPMYRDALLLGKLLGGLMALAIGFLSLSLLTIGLGLLLLGLPPSTEEMVRIMGFLVATIAYSGVWLALALLFSIVFQKPTTAALAALGVWLLIALFWSVITPVLATLIAGPPEGILGPNLAYLHTAQTLDRISPNTLYAEIALALLQPATRALGPVLYSQVQGALLGAPLPASQSFILVWPQITGLIAGMMVIFAIAYVVFRGQQNRA
jgi:ABC-2 type transport system permease protein